MRLRCRSDAPRQDPVAIDYVTYTEEVYGPVLDRSFSDAELQQLITFFKTAGQKVVVLQRRISTS
ncbi:MAG TPA: DUF2059 domain-containing protein [Thermoanaerobaculia bacterium]|nr:DUF2059 domain-containing protein [Thermoanaerobaculia bacterium]